MDILARRTGKTLTNVLEAVWCCLKAPQGSRGRHAILVSQDARNSVRVMLDAALRIVDQCPEVEAEVVKIAADSITFRNGTTLTAMPCRPEAVRGLDAICVVLDEWCFFRNSDGRAVDSDMLIAVQPCLAISGGRLLCASSPYAQTGAAWSMYTRYFGKDDVGTCIWQGTAAEMNPKIPVDYMQRLEREDPEAFRSEILGEFRAGLSLAFDAEILASSIEQGQEEMSCDIAAPVIEGFVDVATGAKHGDSFAAAVGIADGEHQRLAAVREWKPGSQGFKPDEVIASCAAFLKSWGLDRVEGDRFAGQFVVEAFRRHGITYVPSVNSASDVYQTLLPRFNAGKIRLLDNKVLLDQFRSLERRTSPSGRDKIVHPRNKHDDLANAVCGALNLVAHRQRVRCRQCTDRQCTGLHPRWLGVPPEDPVDFSEMVRKRGALGYFPGVD